MKLITNGRPHYGRLSDIPELNWQDFQMTTPFERPISGVAARLKAQFGYKAFQFVSINNAEVMLGLAVVDLGWVGHGFFYCYDHTQNEAKEISHLQLAGFQTTVTAEKSTFKKSDFQIELWRTDHILNVKVTQGEQVLLAAEIEQGEVDPLLLCSPTGATGWTYTRKQTTQTVTGRYFAHDEWHDITPEVGFLAGTDDSCGFLSHQTSWHWLSISTTLSSGVRLGLNLAMGVNQGFGTENALWIDGHMIEIAPVMFDRLPEDDDVIRWRIYTADGRLDLLATVGWSHQESKNFGLVASHFNQWVALIDGVIQCEGQSHVLQGVMGLLEKHYARW